MDLDAFEARVIFTAFKAVNKKLYNHFEATLGTVHFCVDGFDRLVDQIADEIFESLASLRDTVAFKPAQNVIIGHLEFSLLGQPKGVLINAVHEVCGTFEVILELLLSL